MNFLVKTILILASNALLSSGDSGVVRDVDLIFLLGRSGEYCCEGLVSRLRGMWNWRYLSSSALRSLFSSRNVSDSFPKISLKFWSTVLSSSTCQSRPSKSSIFLFISITLSFCWLNSTCNRFFSFFSFSISELSAIIIRIRIESHWGIHM